MSVTTPAGFAATGIAAGIKGGDRHIAQYNPKLRSNYHEALRASIKIKSKMKIVPVKTFNEALNYLREME